MFCSEKRLLGTDKVSAAKTRICYQHQIVTSTDWTVRQVPQPTLIKCRRSDGNDTEGISHFHRLSEFDENLDTSLGAEDGWNPSGNQGIHSFLFKIHS